MTLTSLASLCRVASAAACTLALTGAAACTGGSESPEDPPAPGGPTGGSPAVAMQVRVAQVSGKLAKSKRSDLERKVGEAISAYFDAAFLSGDYPGADFDEAFDAFTNGAAKKAVRDRELLTHAKLAKSTESVTAKKKLVSLSVLSPNDSAVGVTAHIRLVYLADRGKAGATRVTTSGRLLLSHRKSGGWEIFGYDLARSTAPGAGGNR